ncbi:hypothetical protein HK098_003658, partial [Nowakowskiella sp. JEL0407]
SGGGSGNLVREDIAEYLMEEIPDFRRDLSLVAKVICVYSSLVLKNLFEHISVNKDGWILYHVLSVLNYQKVSTERNKISRVAAEDLTSITYWEDLLTLAVSAKNPVEDENNLEIVKVLVSNGANVNIRTQSSVSELTFSIKSSDEKVGYEICKVLIDAGSVVADEQIDLAIKSGKLEILKLFLSLRPMQIDNVLSSTMFPSSAYPSSGQTLLHRAEAADANAKLLKLLLSRGANLTAMEKEGYSVMGFAAMENALHSISFLLDYEPSLANKIALNRPGHSKLPIELLSRGKSIFRLLPDFQEIVAQFLGATSSKRVLLNSSNHIIMERSGLMEE